MAKRSNILKDVFNLSFPQLCCACKVALDENEKYICTSCRLSLPLTNFHLLNDNPLIKMFWGRVPLQYATSYFYFSKESRVQRLIHNIKYHGLKDLAVDIGKMMGNAIKENSNFTDSVEVVIPVPLHPKKLKIRGFNQSECLAEGISRQLNKKMNKDNIIRVVHSPSQTRKSRYHRWENVSGIFEVRNEEELVNKHILLIDDVVTTGSTIEACYTAVKNIHGVRISVAAIAFAHDK